MVSLALIKSCVGWFLTSTLAGGTLWLFFDKDALRGGGSWEVKAFSFARVQLWWWTVLILGSWTVIYALRHELWPFNEDCLILMGISVGTTATARIIDDRDNAAGSAGALNTRSEGFFRDILSDGTGLSVHRFQCFLFNLAFGLTFLVRTFGEARNEFPTFDATTLSLLGASTGGYLLLKATEATSSTTTVSTTSAAPTPAARKPAVAPAAATKHEELVDPDDDDALDH